MDAFTVARELLGEIPLSPEQLAQLRAINQEHNQRLFALLRSPAAAEASVHDEVLSPSGRTARELTPAEAAELRRTLEADVLGLLTPDQRRLRQER